MDVRRSDERVWIDGVQGFGPDEFASSVHGAQTRILQALGENMSYDDLVCYGAFAFRVQVSANADMCPSAGHPCCGFMCVEGSNRAMPRRLHLFEAFPGAQRSAEERARFKAAACAAIKRSIDLGIPVQYGSEEDSLIIGYTDEGRRWWCLHPYYRGGHEPFWHDEADGFAGGQWPWGIAVWREPKPDQERVPDRELTLAALRQAVEMWHARQRDAYFVGDAAYAHWLSWLRDVQAGKVEDPKTGMQGNGWCFDVLIHSRRIAGRWLDRKANILAGRAAAQLQTAAHHYAEIADQCLQGFDCPWDLAPGPQRYEEWTSELRVEQIARLELARHHDQAAIAAIQDALTSC